MTLNLKLPKSQEPGSEVMSPTFKMPVGLVTGPAYREKPVGLVASPATQGVHSGLSSARRHNRVYFRDGMVGRGTRFRRKGGWSELGQRDRLPVLNPECGPAPSTVLEQAGLTSPHRTQQFFSNQGSHRQVNR